MSAYDGCIATPDAEPFDPEAALREIRELHSEAYTSVAYDNPPGTPTFTRRCEACGKPVPCPTLVLATD